MAKAKAKGVIKILLIIVCIVSLGGGVFSTVAAAKQKTVYDENMAIVNDYIEKYETDGGEKKFNSIFDTILYYKVKAKENADNARILAEDAKKQFTKYSVLAAVLYFASLMMLISFIAVIKSKKSKKE
ncbi:MAG: hypothetical protein ACLUFN_00445 [Eubacterium sp.]